MPLETKAGIVTIVSAYTRRISGINAFFLSYFPL
jgi:hypothetical protein